MDLLSSAGAYKAGWLERRKRATLLAGASWRKGFWVLDGQKCTFKEYPSEEAAEKDQNVMMEIDPRRLQSVEKDSNQTLLVITKDIRIQFRCATEEECDDWIFSFEELASILMQDNNNGADSEVPRKPGESAIGFIAAEMDGQEMVMPPLDRETSSAGLNPKNRMSSAQSSSSPLGKAKSARSLFKAASMRLSASPSTRSMRVDTNALNATSAGQTAVPATPSPAGSVDSQKKSFFEKDMIDTRLFMNKARSLALSITRGVAESARLKTGSADTEKPSDRSNRALILPSQGPDEQVDPSRYEKTPEQKDMLLAMIKTNLLNIGNNIGIVDSAQSVLDAMYYIEVPRCQKLIEQGQPVERLFVLEKGSVGVYSQDYVNRPMQLEIVKDKPGEVFGVLPVIHNQPGLFTCKTHSDCKLWALSRQKLHEIAAKEARKKAAKNIQILERIPLLADNLDKNTINQLADCMHVEEVPQNGVIVRKGEPIRRVIVIADGVVEMIKAEKTVRLKRGDIFGEWVLLHGANASNTSVSSEADLIAKSQYVRIITLAVDEVEGLVGPLRALFMKRWRDLRKHESGESSNSDRSLNAQQMTSSRSLQQGSSRSLPTNSVNSTQQLMENLAFSNPMLANGNESKAEEDELIRQAALAIRSRESTAPSIHSARALAALSKESKDESSDDDDDSSSEESDDEGNLDEPFDKAAPLRPELDLRKLEIKGEFGKGNFGTIHLAVHGNERFALKVISGEFITRHGWEYSIENERDAMLEISSMASPFLLKMFNYFADDRNVYMLLELCEGGSLLDLLSQTSSKCISEEVAQFYLANVVLSLEHLQYKNICYRDLKPENAMITDTGYCKLIDFGLAKKTLRTYTVCGTPEYTAPEVLHRIGHGTAVDWWACGILLYEMTCGTTPFRGSDPMAVYESILAHEHPNDIVYPKGCKIDIVTKNLIADFLTPLKSKRLGVRYPGVRGVKAHEFFAKFDWDALERLKMVPPIRPQGSTVTQVLSSGPSPVSLMSAPEDKTGWTRKFGAGLRIAN